MNDILIGFAILSVLGFIVTGMLALTVEDENCARLAIWIGLFAIAFTWGASAASKQERLAIAYRDGIVVMQSDTLRVVPKDCAKEHSCN